MSMSTPITLSVPSTLIVGATVPIGPRGLPGPPGEASVSFGGDTPTLSTIRFVGVTDHVGAPNAADGTFEEHDVAWDPSGQQWLCVAGGTPGTWVAVGTGKVLASVRIASQFVMAGGNPAVTGPPAIPANTEDITGAFFSFTYDGRPIFFKTTPLATSVTTSPAAAAKLIQLMLRRSSDGAIQANAYREQETALNGQIQPHILEAGPFTAWPSDGVPFVVGTTYQVKLSIQTAAGSVAATNGLTQPYSFYVQTA